MPMIDYNRIYQVRSRERQGVLYSPGMIPDEAGALLRAGAPALSARLSDAEARAKEKQNRLRAQYAALGNLINASAQVGRAVAGAIERRDEADFGALRLAWQQHMNAGAADAYTREYMRAGADGKGGDGPMVAIERLNLDFDNTEAFANANERVKRRFAQWRPGALEPYREKGLRLQQEANARWQDAVMQTEAATRDEAITGLYGSEDGAAFLSAVSKTAAWKMNQVLTRAGLGRVDEETGAIQWAPGATDTDKAAALKMREDIVQGYNAARLAAWVQEVAEDDSPSGSIAAARESDIEQVLGTKDAPVAGREALVSDEQRRALFDALTKAKAARERNVRALHAADRAAYREAAYNALIGLPAKPGESAADIKARGRLSAADLSEVADEVYIAGARRAVAHAEVDISRALEGKHLDPATLQYDAATMEKVRGIIDAIPYTRERERLQDAFGYGPAALRAALKAQEKAAAALAQEQGLKPFSNAFVEAVALYGVPRVDAETGRVGFDPTTSPADRLDYLAQEHAERGTVSGAQLNRAMDKMREATDAFDPSAAFAAARAVGIDLEKAYEQTDAGRWREKRGVSPDKRIARRRAETGEVQEYTQEALVALYETCRRFEAQRAAGLQTGTLEDFLRKNFIESPAVRQLRGAQAAALVRQVYSSLDEEERNARATFSADDFQP